MTTQLDSLLRCEQVVRKASAWSAEKQQADGSFAGREDLSNYHKAAYCHAVSGHGLQVGRVARACREHGKFAGGHVEGVDMARQFEQMGLRVLSYSAAIDMLLVGVQAFTQAVARQVGSTGPSEETVS